MVVPAPAKVGELDGHGGQWDRVHVTRSDDKAAYAGQESWRNVTSYTDENIPARQGYVIRCGQARRARQLRLAGRRGVYGASDSSPALLLIGANEGTGAAAADS
jgi:hypothetical protein